MGTIFRPSTTSGGNGRSESPIDRIINELAGADIATAKDADRSLVGIFRLVTLGLLAVDILLVWVGLGQWPELTLLSMGVAGLTWALSNISAFRIKGVTANRATQVGAMMRALAGLGAPVVAAIVTTFSQITYRQGAGFLAGLLAASTIMFAIGKALDFKATLANLLVCSIIALAINVLPEPPRSSPPPSFENDIKTDVTLQIQLKMHEPGEQATFGIGYSCFAIVPRTWFTKRRLLYLTAASTVVDSEPEVKLPYSPSGYVISAHLDAAGLEGPSFAEVEVLNVLPGEFRNVLIEAVKRNAP